MGFTLVIHFLLKLSTLPRDGHYCILPLYVMELCHQELVTPNHVTREWLSTNFKIDFKGCFQCSVGLIGVWEYKWGGLLLIAGSENKNDSVVYAQKRKK